LSSLVGAVVGVTLILVRGRDKNIPIPFGPYLATAGWLALLWGDAITQRYFALLGIPS
jgi:leader peptidase (prepilin peptidase)/N-methyltransferase